MKTNSEKMRFLIFVLSLFIVFPATSAAQYENEYEIKPVGGMSFTRFGSDFDRCLSLKRNQIVGEAEFAEILKKENCSGFGERLGIDFSKHTLLTYRVGGDCFMRVSRKIFRSDAEKKIIVRIRNYWGGCRAGGSVRDAVVIEKIPPDYTVEFSEIKLDKYEESGDGDFIYYQKPETALKPLESREVDLKNCISTIWTKEYVIRDEETFLKAIRNDASRSFCLENIEKIDFGKNSLVGIDINSGYCRRPPGLKARVTDYEAGKKYIVDISYDDTDALCRAMSSYDLWLLVPKIPSGYTVKFNVEPEKRIEAQN